jgi:hypothetical protein
MIKIIYAPNKLNVIGTSVFLAGSIEMGTAEEWQTRVINSFDDVKYDITFLNPRRTDWDSSWEQTIKNDQFREQVEWELEALEKADYVFLYLSPGTKSPISLLELGLFGKDKKITVCCPEGFWRKGNVDIVCKRYKISLFNDFEFATSHMKLRIS